MVWSSLFCSENLKKKEQYFKVWFAVVVISALSIKHPVLASVILTSFCVLYFSSFCIYVCSILPISENSLFIFVLLLRYAVHLVINKVKILKGLVYHFQKIFPTSYT